LAAGKDGKKKDMKKFGVIGFPLSHSFSPAYFKEKFEKLKLSNYNYTACEIEDIARIKNLIQSERLSGFNVTIPHKQSIMTHLDEIDETALEIGSVNCVKVAWEENRFRTKGFNTDWMGFNHLLKRLEKKPKSALVLGTGGAASAVLYTLKIAGIQSISVSRNLSENSIRYSNVNEKVLNSCDLIVNTTPLGMYPNTDQKPDIPYHLLTQDHALIDLIYNPETTAFLNEGRRMGCQTINGLEMLQIQAEASWEIWMSPRL
jgi:shikimate dehydrogenase